MAGHAGCSSTNPIDLTAADSSANIGSPASSLSRVGSLSEHHLSGSGEAPNKNEQPGRRGSKRYHRRAAMDIGPRIPEKQPDDITSAFKFSRPELTLNDFHDHLKHLRCKNPKCKEPLRVSCKQVAGCVREFVEKKSGHGQGGCSLLLYRLPQRR